MPYNATVYRIMIASPSDVSEERNIIRESIHQWNAIHSLHKQLVLMPVGWETHSSPETGYPAQDIINYQVLENADLLVGVFWSRIGTKTKDFSSGTVEEIMKHISMGKPAMLYFSDSPISPSAIDHSQWLELEKFKHYCRENSLYDNYKTHNEFKEKFYRHLQLKVNENPIFKSSTPKPHSSITLSDDATELLRFIINSDDGMLYLINTIEGLIIQAGGRNFTPNASPRETARWKGAVIELESLQLIEPATRSRESFRATNAGFNFFD